MSVALTYDRASAYFTSSVLVAAARGMEHFIENQGRMRLVASPLLRPEDLEAIARGYEARSDVVQRAILRGIFDPEEGLREGDLDRLALLSWLISEDRLDMRVAVPTAERLGIFHEKLAVFTDAWGDVVALSGSPNETRGGLVDNFEAVDVFTSWAQDAERVLRKVGNFERLWSNGTDGLEVVDMPEAVKRELVTTTVDRMPASKTRRVLPVATSPISTVPDTSKTGLHHPHGLELRDYQVTAVENWWLNRHSGILAMATGTGKTVTALAAAADVFKEEGAPLVVVVLAPYIHLVDQWCEEIRRWGVSPIACYESSSVWTEKAETALKLLGVGARDLVFLVSTHATASLPAFRRLLRGIDGSRLMVVADEVHRLGAEGLAGCLPPNASMRLGLSATPERSQDEAGNRRILDYFDEVVFEFGIKDAINAGRLTPYEYLPELVELERDELEEYEDVVRTLERELAKAEGKRDLSRLSTLQNRRSAVLNGARGKLEKLRVDINRHPPSRALVYTAHRRQLSAVMDLCWDRGIIAHQFTGEESRSERQRLLSDLASGRIPALVAIRCLDEGVDVPAALEGYLLASSGNPREFIQRRGRLLRLSPGKDKARIHDFVVVPKGDSRFEVDLIRRELERVMEFASTATNGSTALAPLMRALEEFGFL